MVNTLVLNGHNVIVDEVAFEQKALNEWKNALQNCCIFFVGVTANLEVLESREKERGDRKIGSARHQFYNVHKNVTYDLLIDTSNTKPEQCVSEIVAFVNSALKYIKAHIRLVEYIMIVLKKMYMHAYNFSRKCKPS